MTANDIKDLVIAGATALGLIPVLWGVRLSLKDYRLKLQAETRLKYSAQVEQDIQLLKLFTEIMNIAHARTAVHVSEKAIEMILKPDLVRELTDKGATLSNLVSSAVIVHPVGVAAQDAAIAAIWALALRHEILRPVAIQALESLLPIKADVAKKYLEDLKSRYPNSERPVEVIDPAKTQKSVTTNS